MTVGKSNRTWRICTLVSPNDDREAHNLMPESSSERIGDVRQQFQSSFFRVVRRGRGTGPFFTHRKSMQLPSSARKIVFTVHVVDDPCRRGVEHWGTCTFRDNVSAEWLEEIDRKEYLRQEELDLRLENSQKD